MGSALGGLRVLTGQLLLPGGEILARCHNLALLTTTGGISAFVIAGQQQDDAPPVEVNEHPQQDRLAWPGGVIGPFAGEHVSDLGTGVTYSELVQPLPQGLQPLGARKVDAAQTQDMLQRRIQGCERDVA